MLWLDPGHGRVHTKRRFDVWEVGGANNDAGVLVNYGAAHGALVMTTPGDTILATLAGVEVLVKEKSARVKR